MTKPVTEADTGIRHVRVNGWELWPQRKSRDGKTWLCRWCAKPLSGGCTSYCSEECRQEIAIRSATPSIRRFVFERDKGTCCVCGLNLVDLKAAFDWYRTWRTKLRWDQQKDFPYVQDFMAAAGFRGAHLWEVNHILAIAEGGDPVDPSNFELLCLRCHRKHTKALAGRLAAAKRKK